MLAEIGLSSFETVIYDNTTMSFLYRWNSCANFCSSVHVQCTFNQSINHFFCSEI